MKQFVITPAMGKRLIGKGLVKHPAVQKALHDGTVVVVAGTTNGYVAQELLKAAGQDATFSRKGFRRGLVTPPHTNPASIQATFPGDVILVAGQWLKGKEIFDVVDNLKAGDVILKGGNALDADLGRAAALIAHPMAGTIGATFPAVIGRRVKLIVPIGLEKRVPGDLDDIAAALNDPAAEGPRMAMLPGEVFTEIDAIATLTGATARLVAAGGVYGAEGCLWLTVDGSPQQIDGAQTLINSLIGEPLCEA